MHTIARARIHPGAIVHISEFPFYDDPSQHKRRYAVVLSATDRTVVVRGIYTNEYQGRRPIPATRATGLRYDSYLESRAVELPVHLINGYRGEIPPGFDPFNDFGRAVA